MRRLDRRRASNTAALVLLVGALASCGADADERDCPRGAILSREDDISFCAPLGATGETPTCTWHSRPAHARVCIARYPGNFEYGATSGVSDACAPDGTCPGRDTCTEFDYCEESTIGVAVGRVADLAEAVDREGSALTLLAVSALLALAVRGGHRRMRSSARRSQAQDAPGASLRDSRASADPIVVDGQASVVRHGLAARWRARAWCATGIGTLALVLLAVVSAYRHQLPTGAADLAYPFLFAASTGVIAAGFSMARSWAALRPRRVGARTIRVEATSLILEGDGARLVIPRAHIARGIVVGDRRLELGTTDARSIVLQTESAGRLLEALELDATRRAATFRWERPSGAR